MAQLPLGYRHAGCLQLSHRRPPEMCGLRTRPRADADPLRSLPPSNCHRRGHIVSPPSGRQLVRFAARRSVAILRRKMDPPRRFLCGNFAAASFASRLWVTRNRALEKELFLWRISCINLDLYSSSATTVADTRCRHSVCIRRPYLLSEISILGLSSGGIQYSFDRPINYECLGRRKQIEIQSTATSLNGERRYENLDSEKNDDKQNIREGRRSGL